MKPFDGHSGFILFSKAICRLQRAMWGGLPRPLEVRKARAILRKHGWHEPSLGFGVWRQRAGECITQAARQGKLRVYLASPPGPGLPVRANVPVTVLKRLLTSRGSLPDQAIRPSIKACEGDENLFLLLKTGFLMLDENEFRAWQHKEYRKGKWPSQRSRSKPRVGRPTKQTDDIRETVVALVRYGVWTAEEPLTDLQRLLSLGKNGAPSTQTLARVLNKLHDETSDPRFRRAKRMRRQRSK